MKKRRENRLRRKASALVTTLLVVVILSTIVVAFMQSMSVEKMVSKSQLSGERADWIANAGVAEAVNVVRDLMVRYPDSATAWVPNMAPAGTNSTPGTAFYYYDSPVVTNAGFSVATNVYYRPLVSGAEVVPFAQRGLALANFTEKTNGININSSSLGAGRLWIGLPPDSASLPIDVPWVQVRDNSGRLVGRYAFWVEDESFRLNIDSATDRLRGGGSLGLGPDEIPIQGVLRAAISSDGERDSVAGEIVSIRDKIPLKGTLQTPQNVNFAGTGYTNLYDKIGFITTLYSSGLNVTRAGARRVDINSLVGTNTLQNDVTTVRRELDSIITAITNQAPNFGQRFYRNSATGTNSPGVTPQNATIYLNKIAANIRDYLDSDSLPTIVQSGGAIYNNGPPSLAVGTLGGANELWAIGKENVPRLQEAVLHIPQLVPMAQPSTPSTPSNWRIRISYYLEFWNMGTRDITLSDLGPHPYIRIANQPGWRDVANPTPALIPEDPSRDFSIPLDVFRDFNGAPLVFRAGEVTVITTDPNPESYTGYFIQDVATARKFFRPPAALVNAAPYIYGNGLGAPPLPQLRENPPGGFGGRPTLMMNTRTASASGPTTAGSDYETEVILGNDYGWLDSHPAAVAVHPGILVDSFGNKANMTRFHARGGALVGNISAASAGNTVMGDKYQVGDPRVNNEQLNFQDSTIGAAYQTRFVSLRNTSASQSTDGAGQAFSLGRANTALVDPTANPRPWDEANNARTLQPFGNGGSPAFYRNGPMQTIGELGHIYDPVRFSSSATDAARSLGGGRTIKMGQPESVAAASGIAMWDKDPFSASRRWASWRLADIFTTTDQTEIPGLINPNGVLRDGGAAIKALLEGLNFSGANDLTDATLVGKSISANDRTIFATSLSNRLALNQPPLFERGELSEIEFFNQNTTANVSPFRSVLDRGREEIFRRMLELITTRGNTYTVYAVGQSVTQLPNGNIRVDATRTRKATFRLSPQYETGDLAYDPSDATSVKARFASPTNYVVKVLNEAGK